MFRDRFFPYEPQLLIILVSLLAAGVIWIRTATVSDTYLYVSQEKELIKEQQEVQAVKLRWLKLTSPKRLESVAKSLDLFPPALHQILKITNPKVSSK
jgi:hypothetical protein